MKPQYVPYITLKLRNMRKVKRRLYLNWKKTKKAEDYKEMMKVSNKLRNSTKKARKRWYGRKMSNYKDSEKSWEFSKDQVGCKEDGTPTIIIKDGVRMTDPKQVADAVFRRSKIFWPASLMMGLIHLNSPENGSKTKKSRSVT